MMKDFIFVVLFPYFSSAVLSPASQQCGSTSSDKSGSFSTPVYDDEFICNRPCTWIIESNSTEKVHLALPVFTAPNKNLIIWTLKNNTVRVHSKYASSQGELIIFPAGASVILHFICQTPKRIQHLHLNYTKRQVSEIQQNDDGGEHTHECTGYLTADSGFIFPPISRGRDRLDDHCFWIIESSSEKTTYLNVLALQPNFWWEAKVTVWIWTTKSLRFRTAINAPYRDYEFQPNQSILLFYHSEPKKSNWGFNLYYEKIAHNDEKHNFVDAMTPYLDFYGRKVSVPYDVLQTQLDDGIVAHERYMWIVFAESGEEVSLRISLYQSQDQLDSSSSATITMWALDTNQLQLVTEIELHSDEQHSYVINRTIVILVDMNEFYVETYLSVQYRKYSKPIYGNNSFKGVENLSAKRLEQCGWSTANSSGNIRMPYSTAHDSAKSCLWLIVAEANEETEVEFTHFDVPDDSFDNILLWKMDENSVLPYGVYSNKPDRILRFNAGQSIFVEFKSFRSVTRSSFNLQFNKYSVVPSSNQSRITDHDDMELTNPMLEREVTPELVNKDNPFNDEHIQKRTSPFTVEQINNVIRWLLYRFRILYGNQ